MSQGAKPDILIGLKQTLLWSYMVDHEMLHALSLSQSKLLLYVDSSIRMTALLVYRDVSLILGVYRIINKLQNIDL